MASEAAVFAGEVITPLENSESPYSPTKEPVPIQACASEFRLFL